MPPFGTGRLAGLAALICLALAASAAMPAPAHALDLNPLPTVEEIVDAIIEKLFGIEGLDGVMGTFIEWLIMVPNYAGNPDNGQLDGNLEELRRTTSGIAFGLMGAVMTFAVIHHWISGLSDLGGDGTELLQAVTRTVGVALLILAWPWIFVNGANVANQVSAVLIDGRDLDSIAAVMGGALAITALFSGPLALIFGILIAIAAAVMLLGLAAMKIVMGAAGAILYAGMPLALVLMPFPAMAWIPRLATRATVTIMALPVIWALVMATAIAVGFDALTLRGAEENGVFNALIFQPLTALALLWLMITIPRLLLRVAALGAALPGGGKASHVMGQVGGRLAANAVSHHVPESFGGKREEWEERQERRQASGGENQPSAAQSRAAGDAARGLLGLGATAATGGAGATAAGAATAAGEAAPTANAMPGTPAGATAAAQNGVKGWVNSNGTFHKAADGLPANPGLGAGAAGQAEEEVRGMAWQAQQQYDMKNPEQQEQYRDQQELAAHAALDQLGRAGYADAAAQYGQSHDPRDVTRRMTQASTAPGLSHEAQSGFLALAAVDPAARSTAISEYSAERVDAAASAGAGGGGEYTAQPSGAGGDPSGGGGAYAVEPSGAGGGPGGGGGEYAAQPSGAASDDAGDGDGVSSRWATDELPFEWPDRQATGDPPSGGGPPEATADDQPPIATAEHRDPFGNGDQPGADDWR